MSQTMKRIIWVGLVSFVVAACQMQSKQEKINQKSSISEMKINMYGPLSDYIQQVERQIQSIPEERKKQLDKLANYIVEHKKQEKSVNLTFICTHNSRRSHMGQIWAATAANYYGVEDVYTFSGGTEATAFNPRAVDALKRAGFKIEKGEGSNPTYAVQFSDSVEAMECFSKKYDDAFNPQDNFAAVMTCSDADENCPFIPGAELRLPITYDDPKEADGTDYEAQRYDERSLQIASEMFYTMLRVKKLA